MGPLQKLHKLELRYEKLLLLVAIVIITLIAVSPSNRDQLSSLIAMTGGFGYAGALLAGVASSWGFAAVPAFAVIYAMGNTLNIFAVAALAALGATIGDVVIFHLARRELSRFVRKEERAHPKISKWAHRFAPAVVGLVIATPLPDEIAAGFLGALRWDEKQFIVLIYVAHFLGFLIVAGAGAMM